MSISIGQFRPPPRVPRINRGRVLAAAGWVLAIAAMGLAIGSLQPLYLAAVVVGCVGTLLAVVHPLLAIPMLLLAIPFGSLPRGEDQATEAALSAVEPAVALLTVAWLLRGVRLHRLRLRAGGVLAALAAVGVLMLFSATYALSFSAAIKETLKWLELLLVMLFVLDAAPDRRSTTWLLLSLFAAGALEAAWGAFQFVTQRGPAAFEVDGALRAYGNFDQPNPFGGYLSTILPVAIAVTLAPGTRRELRWLSGACATVIAGGIALSQSRGAWLGLAVAAVVLLAIWSHRTRLVLPPLFAAGVAGILLVMSGIVSGALVQRASQAVEYFGVFDVRTVELTTNNWAVVERMAHWQAGWLMFLDHPWLGVGAGNYADAYPRYYLRSWVEPLGHAHNYYINTAAELGVVGLVAFLVTVVLVLRHLARPLATTALSSGSEPLFWRALLAGVLGSLVVLGVHNMFDNLLVHGVNAQIGFLLGVGLLSVDRLRAATAEGASRAV